MYIKTNQSLVDYTTIKIGGKAKQLITVETELELIDFLYSGVTKREIDPKLIILGGGSNTIFGDTDLTLPVIRFTQDTIDITNQGETVYVTAAAGGDWNGLVATLIDNNIFGLETLAGIPGSVGGAAVQNIGAYGREISEFVTRVKVFDLKLRKSMWWKPVQLNYSYRSSKLKRNSNFLVLAVELGLPKISNSLPILYSELANYLRVDLSTTLPAATVRDAVLTLRRAKGMLYNHNDSNTWSVGSFFLNPIVSQQMVTYLRNDIGLTDLKVYNTSSDDYKISAAQLIAFAGFSKGYKYSPSARIKISDKHLLALSNTGAGTAKELLKLAHHIAETVKRKFEINLIPEPVFVNISW